MGWYVVVKKIKGIAYRYRQRTWRENGRVQTESIYLGRADGGGRERRSASNGMETTGTINTAARPAILQEKPKQLAEAGPDREPPVRWADKVGKALAEYDRLVSIAQDLYEKSNRASNDEYEKAFGEYLQSKTAITAHQSQALGREVSDWGGGDGGIAGDMYRKEFEDALIGKGNAKKSKAPRPHKIKVPARLPANGDFSGPFWDTPHSPEHLRDQASLYYKEYLKVKTRCEAYHALDVSSWQAARTGKARLSELQSELAWYEGKCRSWFDRKIVFTKSRVILKECK